jgi:hypothetical protein
MELNHQEQVMNDFEIDFTKISRFDEECGSYGGYFLASRKDGEYVLFDDVVKLLAENGIAVKSFETIEREKFEKKMVEKYGENWDK